jgi:ribonuclease P protein component
MPAAPRATFRKHERLCARAVIKELMASGRAVNESPLRLIGKVMPLDPASPAQIAFAVPKRHVPRAVDRNLIRRRLREAYRLNKGRWHQALEQAGVQCAWIVVYQGRTVVPYAAAERKISRAIDRWLLEHVPPAG